MLIATIASLVLGAAGMAAQADDTTNPPAASDTQPSDPATSADATATQGTPDATVREQLLGGPVKANPDRFVLKRGLTGTVKVTANDTCPTTCAATLASKPTGWKVSITASGVVTLKVPATTVPRSYPVTYHLTDTSNPNQSSVGTLTVAVTPDNYKAPSGVVFSHPYRTGYRYKIHDRILRTINSAPPGGRIQVATWSFSSRSYYKALNHARKRGVVVQIVLAQRNKASNSDYRTLRDMFGTTVTSTGSWVKKCIYSCRGRKGTMHAKIFLFSASYRTPYVIMTGSANLTDFAVTNQWNQMNTVSRRKAVYDEGVAIFNQMARDVPAKPMFVSTAYPGLTSYYYPTTTVSTSTDFMYKALSQVHCRDATNTSNGRTIVKIAMYAWYQERGKWLAKQVRGLWEAGCQVQIVYAISSNPVKKTLYSPAGRGRIPMRQILLAKKDGTPIYYLHDKWVAIKGHYGSNRGAALAFQGSFNFSDLGFSSDENFQMIAGSAYFRRFADDFDLLWKDKQARAPSPVSTITNIERTAPASPTLGTGTYRYMEAD
jgi:hypothetical protein